MQRQAVARMIESGPIPAVQGVVRWRLIDLAQWIFEEFRITIAKQTLSRELRAMGYRKLSARPRHHAQAAGAIENFKKTSPRVWKSCAVTPIATELLASHLGRRQRRLGAGRDHAGFQLGHRRHLLEHEPTGRHPPGPRCATTIHVGILAELGDRAACPEIVIT